MEPQTFSKPKTTAKDFFVYLGVMALLYASVISLITLLFQFVNYQFPDQLAGYVDPFNTATRWSLAFLIILFPAFLFGTWAINNDLRKSPEKEDMPIRKWLTYLALFVAGATVLIDLATLVFYLLGGEISTRFILKALIVLVVAAYAFSYYLIDLRGIIRERKNLGHIYGGVALLLVIVSIILGFMVVGSPTTQRAIRMDNERVNHLSSIQNNIVYSHWQQKASLPETLLALEDDINGFKVPVDPETGEPYKYRKINATSFELCAIFSRESVGYENGKGESITYPYDPYYGGNWLHGAGEECFVREIDPELNPPTKTIRQ